MTKQVETVQVPGASLHWEARGSGPVLLMIPGSNGDGGLFDGVADLLSDSYTVVSYDRRGYSRSPLDGAPAGQWIDVNTDDARRLLASVAGPGQPAYVFGSSAGAVIGLDLISRHPELVERLVVHEPPLAKILPDAAEWAAFFDDVYETYRRAGIGPAMAKFVVGIGIDKAARPSVVDASTSELVKRITGNLDFFLAHEVREATSYRPDLAALDAARARIVLAGGQDSRAHFPHRPVEVLAERFGERVVDLPGDHIGYWSQPEPFAAELREALAAG
jgi:pimeloyl-ACP methyl ester carboxylesterase